MFKFINYFKNNVLMIFTISIIFVACFSISLIALNDTYATNTYEIVFNRYEDTEIMNTCYTDVNGKLNDDCITQISKICSKWSLDSIHSGIQKNPIASTDFANITFTNDTKYYCVSGSSGTYDTGCYACKDDESIVHWAASDSGNSVCPGGYKKIHENIDECKVYACYECSDNKNYLKWHFNGISDENCPSGYNKTNIPQNECKIIIPNSCYVCKDNDNVLKWKNDENADSDCSSGYNKTNISQNECIIIENPTTGNIALYIISTIGITCLIYTIYYFNKTNFNIK